MTPLMTVAKVEQEASNMEVEGKEEFEEFEVVTVAIKEDKGEDEGAEEAKVGNNKLEWLGEDLAWLTLLTLVVLLLDFDKRAAGVEWRFQRELEAAREELVAARAQFAVAKQTLVTLVGYRHDCQAFLAWKEENNIGEEDWEEENLVEVPDDNADLGL
ncbi:hypothetical protein C0989_003905 [Termitomyces sp. Mn162]|nr:hypothetical protein C0989_003905 [Termitomyces sp. Mn162]